jgi:replicative DNA helicase
VVPPPQNISNAWTDDQLALLAHLIGDGSMGPSFKYATADPANRDLVIGLARSMFGIEASYTKEGNTYQVRFPSPYRLTHGVRHPMSNWTDPLGLFGSRSWNTFVPSSIFGCCDAQIGHFLHHLWATDGSITIDRNGRGNIDRNGQGNIVRNGQGNIVRVAYATTSERLALDVQQLLLRLGIHSTIGMTKKARVGGGEYRPGFAVRVQGTSDQTNFLTTVGCFGQRSQVISEALAIAGRQTPSLNTDLVLREISSAVRDARIAETVRSSTLSDAAASDVFWDRIVSIESTGQQPTFDATVAGTHNFIADGIVAHNSLEQDADVVMFIYRDEIYNPDSPDRGTAEIIVAKHRSGPVGTSRLAFLDHYTKFANMAKGI